MPSTINTWPLQQLQCNKIAILNAQLMKIEEASRKREEQTTSFISTTREALEQKMDAYQGNREAHLTDLKSKMKVVRLDPPLKKNCQTIYAYRSIWRTSRKPDCPLNNNAMKYELLYRKN